MTIRENKHFRVPDLKINNALDCKPLEISCFVYCGVIKVGNERVIISHCSLFSFSELLDLIQEQKNALKLKPSFYVVLRLWKKLSILTLILGIFLKKD